MCVKNGEHSITWFMLMELPFPSCKDAINSVCSPGPRLDARPVGDPLRYEAGTRRLGPETRSEQADELLR